MQQVKPPQPLNNTRPHCQYQSHSQKGIIIYSTWIHITVLTIFAFIYSSDKMESTVVSASFIIHIVPSNITHKEMIRLHWRHNCKTVCEQIKHCNEKMRFYAKRLNSLSYLVVIRVEYKGEGLCNECNNDMVTQHGGDFGVIIAKFIYYTNVL